MKIITRTIIDQLKRNAFHITGLLLIILAYLLLPFIPIISSYQDSLKTGLAILLYIISGWIISRLVNYGFKLIIKRKYQVSKPDDIHERSMQTKLKYINTIINVIIWVFVIALIFSLFEKLSTIGTSILASAGIAGIIIGFAAQKPIANVIAGFQIAFTQPIRIGDAVIVEDEWGWIEELTLTYVVVKVWDKRRLVLPISYFVEKTFQNWTKKTADLIGTVYLYTDYNVPVEKLREELKRIIKRSKLWDKEVAKIQVTDATEKSMQLRILVSARNSPDAWNLRCHVREKMIEYISKNYPGSLPVTRATISEKKSSKAGKKRKR